MSTTPSAHIDGEATGTRSRILEYLKLHGARRIDDITTALSLSKSTVRAHLLRLEEAALIERQFLPSDGPGRPALAFDLSADGHSHFPNDEASVLTGLLNFLKEESQESLIQQYFTSLWTQRSKELERVAGGPLDSMSLPERQDAVLKLLGRHGFMPELITDEDNPDTTHFVMRECNCPFPAAIRATRIPCLLERAFLSKALGQPVQSVILAEEPGQGHCDFVFGDEAAEPA